MNLFRSAALLLSSALLGLCYGVSRQSDDIHACLEAWTDKDLLTQSKAEQAKFIHYLKTVLPKSAVENPFYSPDILFQGRGHGYVWRLTSQPVERFVVYAVSPGNLNPGTDLIRCLVVDPDGKVLSQSEFDLGWNMSDKGTRFQPVDWLGTPVIVQNVGGYNGPRKIYVSFDGDRPALVRIDDKDGSPYVMQYLYPNFVVGPDYAPTKNQVIRALSGQSTVDRLEALVWLTGGHGDSDRPRGEVVEEDPKQEVVYKNLIHSPTLKKLVLGLRQDSNPYVRKLALQVPLGTGLYPHDFWASLKSSKGK